MTTVDIVASSYNAAPFVPLWRCSILRTSPWQVNNFFVTDSMSTDYTRSLLLAMGVEVISCRCTLGMGRNLAMSRTQAPFVMVVDVDNEYDLSRVPLPLPENRILVVQDYKNPHAWAAVGPRRLFRACPFIDMGGPASGGGLEDLVFFSQAPVVIRRIRGFAVDLKRRSHLEPPTLLPLRNEWRRSGLRYRDILIVIALLLQDRKGLTAAAKMTFQIAADALTLGLAGRWRKYPDE